ncbi:MAG: hypothetical protein SVM79_08635 [Chloroflexota bacterium]|nr:hypothetical protein [Chloroflexota bacterium]
MRWIGKSEDVIVEQTGEVYPELFVVGVTSSAVYGCPWIGAIVGGMLLSLRRAAEMAITTLRK